MTETLIRARMRDDGETQERIEARLEEMAEQRYRERRDRDLEDQHILELADYYQPY